MLQEANKDNSPITGTRAAASHTVASLEEGLSHVIIGQKHLVRSMIIALLTDGHLLVEGVPGLAKTLAIKSMASLINADFSRIQFTPDLLPADVTGTLVYNHAKETFVVKKGPIFAHFVLADEINRAPAKVQSALLEAMQERQVTIGDTTYSLEEPFMVMATQNPIEEEGTYPLPEAQLDRFMIKVLVDYPTAEEEEKVVRLNMRGEMPQLKPIIDREDIRSARRAVNEVHADDKIVRYAVSLVMVTRRPEECGLESFRPMIRYGASPRASIYLILAARATALLEGRDFVLPEDVRDVAHDVLRHRIGLSYEAEAERITADQIVDEILNKVIVP